MKKYIIYSIVLFISLGLTSCDTDLLDKNPKDRLSSSEFWKSKSDFEMALTAVYASLQGGGGIVSYGMPNWDVLTDNAYGQHNYWNSQTYVQGNISPSTGGYITDLYNTCYQGITRVNIFLEKLEQYQGTDMDANVKSQYEAEARFIRGYYYYLLYFAYGAVPISTEPLNLETQIQPKSTQEEVLNQSLTDIDFAIANLPTALYPDANGHAVKTSAQGLKLRVLMDVAYNESGSVNTEIMTSARDLALELMSSGYKLDENYEAVFRDGTQEMSPEIMFSIKFLAPDNATAMDQWYGDWIVVSPLQNLVDTYSEGDLRFEKSIFKDVVEIDGNTHSPSNDDPTGYGLKKFLSPGLMPYGYSTQSQQDWVMLRYAEVLLSYAEAQNELQGPSQSVLDAVNQVRARAGLAALQTGLDKVTLRQHIKEERRIEFAFEGLRYYDLKRWRIAEEVLSEVNDGVLSYYFEDAFYLWPLPQTEIDKSQGVLVQNPDY